MTLFMHRNTRESDVYYSWLAQLDNIVATYMLLHPRPPPPSCNGTVRGRFRRTMHWPRTTRLLPVQLKDPFDTSNFNAPPNTQAEVVS